MRLAEPANQQSVSINEDASIVLCLNLRKSATALLRDKCPEEADLLSRAAVRIDAAEVDMALAVALVDCAKRQEARRPAMARHMRDAALHLILIE
jgi:hypothetical protein